MVKIEKTIHGGGKVDKFGAVINLKAFLMELYNWFEKENFKDILGENTSKKKLFLDGWAKKGEFIDNKAKDISGNDIPNNRTGEMYETKYVLIKKDFANEFEIAWKCFKSSAHSSYGWYEVKIDLVVRDMKDIEIMENGTKKIMQSGTWEFRNQIIYKNSYYEDYLQELPFIKDRPYLQDLIFNRFHKKLVHEDFYTKGLLKLKPTIYGIINKHFKNY